MRRSLPLLAMLVFPGLVSGRESRSLDEILREADAPRWEARWRAVEALARIPETEFPKARRLLLEDPRPRVREALAFACLLDPRLGDATLLGLALRRDRNPAVRRAAARALGRHRDRRAVSALVEALGRESDPRTRLWIAATLRSLASAPCVLDAEAWRSWWSRNEHDPKFRPADPGIVEKEYDGVPLETRTVAAPPPAPGARPFPHLLALPQFGWSTASFGPYLLPLSERSGITWVRLPSIQRLTGRSGFGADVPVYPVDRLVHALEAFRAESGFERFVLLAHGASGWIAMRFAQLHPHRCAALLLIDTALDRDAYAAALRRAADRGTPGERYVARTLLHENREPFDAGTLERIQAVSLERAFRDAGDLEIGELLRSARDPQGFATVPPLRFEGSMRIEAPSLFLYSAGSPFSGHVDAERIGRHFPASLVAPVLEATGLPFLEENRELFRIVEGFFRRYPPE
ncbi:MAG: alpha/beta fold hydrolase [Planctomycetaceae bacterium]